MFRDRTPDAFAWLHPALGASDGMTDKEKGLSPSPLFAFSRGCPELPASFYDWRNAMLSDTQISRLLDVANAACHGGNVVDARAMYAGVLALRPGFAPALMGKALSPYCGG